MTSSSTTPTSPFANAPASAPAECACKEAKSGALTTEVWQGHEQHPNHLAPREKSVPDLWCRGISWITAGPHRHCLLGRNGNLIQQQRTLVPELCTCTNPGVQPTQATREHLLYSNVKLRERSSSLELFKFIERDNN
jgi:hypothetical protein